MDEEITKDAEVVAPELSDIDAAKKLIEDEKNRRMNACHIEIMAILQKYDCSLDASIQINSK